MKERFAHLNQGYTCDEANQKALIWFCSGLGIGSILGVLAWVAV